MTFSPAGSPMTLFGQAGPTTPQLLLDSQQGHLLSQYFQTQPLAEPISEPNLPSVATVTRNLLQKHCAELKDTQDPIPRVQQINTLRKSFRDFYTKEQTHLFSFLDAPVQGNELLSTAQQIVKRFGRADYNGNRAKVRDLCLDLSCNEAVDAVQEMSKDVSLRLWVDQTKSLFETWRLALSQLLAAETKMEQTLKTFHEMHKRVGTLLQLPPNSAYDAMVTSTEAYLKQIFEEAKLEDTYKEYILSLKKLIVLSDVMHVFKMAANTTNEPVCSVCMNEPVGLALVPCGHTFCQTCGQKQMISCYVCRTPTKDRQKIFFS
jgi:hypothetical protein